MDFKEINPLWRLSDPLTVQQAAALIAGFDPNAVRFKSNDPAWFENDGFTESNGISWVQTAFAALVNAINARKLKATIRRTAWERGWDEEPEEGQRLEKQVTVLEEDSFEARLFDPVSVQRRGVIYRVSPDWNLTTVAVTDLRAWLESAGIRVGFFFPAATDAPDYLDPKNPRYAPKLAAAVRAWQSVTDAGGKHPKQALAKWLREHAAEFSLSDDDGKPNETGIEEAAKVANWQPGGGAPKTPGE